MNYAAIPNIQSKLAYDGLAASIVFSPDRYFRATLQYYAKSNSAFYDCSLRASESSALHSHSLCPLTSPAYFRIEGPATSLTHYAPSAATNQTNNQPVLHIAFSSIFFMPLFSLLITGYSLFHVTNLFSSMCLPGLALLQPTVYYGASRMKVKNAPLCRYFQHTGQTRFCFLS